MTMNITARKYHRKQQAAKKRQDQDAKDRAAMFGRAFKSRGGTRLDVTTMSPQQRVGVLTDYCSRLEVLRDDLATEFEDLREFADASRWLSVEIRRCLEEIVRASIEFEAAGR